MQPEAIIAAALALCAALASAVGDVIRQRSAQEITDKPDVGHLELFRMSLRDLRFWGGGIAAVANYGLQAAALVVGSVMLVTGLQVTALLFALPIYARITKQAVSRAEWLWAAVLAAALAVVVIVGDPTPGRDRASGSVWLVVALVMIPLLVVCVVMARRHAGTPTAAVLLAVVAGASLAMFAVLTKSIVAVAHDGFWAVLTAPELVPWLAATLTGMIFQQSAFRAGALTASMPTITVAKPLVATVLGILVLGEHLQAGGVEDVAVAVSLVLVIVATAKLARGEAATIAASAGGRDTALPAGARPER
ncbi:DMT family transporter [Mycolicibacillus trivialis]|uniref:Dehydrogenase n=1 Tax=Mycolicibacillus trivialis TaxID=1798 RepID=A0A1X2EG70_9MYCO|nr:DMT family transporter [Mycolicibacillus trivialis]ORX01056.1 hypothetical protein AWC30_14345 [Mycolicibacillus trivialis]